jgi:hypothetical protein
MTVEEWFSLSEIRYSGDVAPNRQNEPKLAFREQIGLVVITLS